MKTRQRMISLIMPAYNCEQFIEKSLQSIFYQTLSEDCYEVIIVNDGSTDNTSKLLDKYAGKIKLLNQSNQGLAAACNRALKEAQGNFIMRLDPDDYYDRNLFSLTVNLLESKLDYQGVYTDRYEVDILNNTRKRVDVGQDNLFDMIACGMLFRREAFERIGFYRNLLFEEYDLMLRFLEEGFKAFYMREPMYYHVKHGCNMTSRKEYWEEGWKELCSQWGEEKLKKYVDIQVKTKGESRFQPCNEKSYRYC